MDYFTLTRRGHAWIVDEAPPPAKYERVLAALAELITDNDVPRTAAQVSFAAEVTPAQASEGLRYLSSANYVTSAAAPKPSAKGETAKLRIRPIEELAAAEARAEASRLRYAQSPKGRAAHERYEDSEKGRAKNVKYWSERGRVIQRAYRLRRRLKELLVFVAANPEEEARIRPDIDKVNNQLAELAEESKEVE